MLFRKYYDNDGNNTKVKFEAMQEVVNEDGVFYQRFHKENAPQFIAKTREELDAFFQFDIFATEGEEVKQSYLVSELMDDPNLLVDLKDCHFDSLNFLQHCHLRVRPDFYYLVSDSDDDNDDPTSDANDNDNPPALI